AAQAPVPAAPEMPGTSDVTETVISIIMEATGYDRDEIEPDMDLREDLSIRSSRLPVIMDALETHFSIKIELEDFMDVRTIRDISEKISEVVSRETDSVPSPAPKTSSVSTGPEAISPTVEPSDEKQSLKRVVFSEVPLENGQFQPIELDTMESVAIFSSESKSELSHLTGDVFRRDYGVNSIPLAFVGNHSAGGDNDFDLLTLDGASRAAERLDSIESLAGIVFILDDAAENRLSAIEKTPDLLTGFFVLLKTFLNSSSKKFVILLHKSGQPNGPARVLAEGMLGMFLSLGHEFSSVQFRTIRLDEKTDLEAALRGALDRSRNVVETIYRDGQVFTRAGHVEPSIFGDGRKCPIRAGGLVVLSGGAYGITSYLARSLAILGCRLVFLGRTMLDPEIDYASLLAEDVDSRENLTKSIEKAKPGISAEQLEQETSQAAKALEIIRQVEELRSLGIDASYFSCDVTNGERTNAVIEEIVTRHGAIDGIIHGAGILRDNLAKQMTPEDFAAVMDVKFRGAWNLYSAAQKAGLRFFACLSSAAAIQGNPGQANYSAANRMMSGLMEHLKSTDDSITFKALMLPPIEGSGMADDPEIRALMKRMNAAYVHADELEGLFYRELFFGAPEEVWVLFMRSLPDLKSVRLDSSEAPPDEGEMETCTVVFKSDDFPMIDSVSFADLSKGELSATRIFSRKKDLWISDHKPFKFLRHPLVSAIMALETFMEASRLLYPYLKVVGIRNAEFLDIIECPPEVERSSVVSCRRVESAGSEVVCDVSLATHEISPSGQVMERMYKNFRSLVILGNAKESPAGDPPGFPVRLDELDTRPMNHAEVLDWYNDRSDMQGRYRILRELDGTGAGAVRGRFIYDQNDDLASPLKSRYQYSPYLLEALMQVVNFYVVMRDRNEQRAMIPYKIGEVAFYKNCAVGENLTLEGRLKQQSEEGIVWDARAVDEKGATIIVARQMMMRWFTP
ncbi:MAG: SDR family NAD(P)-dependent oxidoreductase, partial [Deltaproteobacteria bacterium]